MSIATRHTSASSHGSTPSFIESKIKLHIDALDKGFSVVTDGMGALGKPEMYMHVDKGMYLATACRIMNDTAEYIVKGDKNPDTGQRLQLAPWTVVEFTKEVRKSPDGRTISEVISLSDGSEMDYFEMH